MILCFFLALPLLFDGLASTSFKEPSANAISKTIQDTNRKKMQQATSSTNASHGSAKTISVLIHDLSFNIDLSKYSFYEIQKDDSFSYSGVSADCLAVYSDDNVLPFKILFKNLYEGYLLEVGFFDKNQSLIYTTSIQISEETYNSYNIVPNALNEDVKERILQEESFYFNYPTYDGNPSIPYRSPIISVTPISGGGSEKSFEEKAEELTSSDEKLQELMDYGITEYIESDGKHGCNIGEYIPEECFSEAGDYFYVGKEYGFAVHTIYEGVSVSNLYRCESFVSIFDIETIVPGTTNIDNIEFQITVRPVYFYVFKYDTVSIEDTTSYYWYSKRFSPKITEIIYPYSKATFGALSNVKFFVSTRNKNEPNFGDNGYVAEEDNGDFIIQTRYNFSGTSKTQTRGNYFLDIVDTITSYIPFVKDIKSAVNVGTDALDLFSNTLQFFGYDGGSNNKYHFTSEHSYNNEANISTKYTDAMTQIDQYGGLLKTCLISPSFQYSDENVNSSEKVFTKYEAFVDDSSLEITDARNNIPKEYNPLLLRNYDEHYVSASVMFNHANNRLPSNESILMYGISMDICTQKPSGIWGDAFPQELQCVMSGHGFNELETSYQRTLKVIHDSEKFEKDFVYGEIIRFRYDPTLTGTHDMLFSSDSNAEINIYYKGTLFSTLYATSSNSLKSIGTLDIKNIITDKADSTDNYYFEIIPSAKNGKINFVINKIDNSINSICEIDLTMTQKSYVFEVYASDTYSIYKPNGWQNFKYECDVEASITLSFYDKNFNLLASGESISALRFNAKMGDFLGYLQVTNDDEVYPLNITLICIHFKLYYNDIIIVDHEDPNYPIIPKYPY